MNENILSKLSPRQADIAKFLTSGLRNKEIAEELHLSPSTIKNHLYMIYAKLGLTSERLGSKMYNRIKLVNLLLSK